MQKATLRQVIELLEGTVGANSKVTCTQFLTVLHAVVTGGISQKDLADKLDITEGAVSRNMKVLGPEGSSCMCKDGKLVKADPHVIERVNAIMNSW